MMVAVAVVAEAQMGLAVLLVLAIITALMVLTELM
jgi:hypothetical protein